MPKMRSWVNKPQREPWFVVWKTRRRWHSVTCFCVMLMHVRTLWIALMFQSTGEGENLVNLENCSATAVLEKGGTIFCEPQIYDCGKYSHRSSLILASLLFHEFHKYLSVGENERQEIYCSYLIYEKSTSDMMLAKLNDWTSDLQLANLMGCEK